MEEQRKPATTQLYTVIVVSDHSQAVRKFRVPRPWLRRGAWIGGAAVLLGLVAMLHYFSLLGSAAENRVLKEENAQLRSQILLVQEKVAHISGTLERVERFDAKLRTAVTQLQDPGKDQPQGPVAPAPGALAGVPGPAPQPPVPPAAQPGTAGGVAAAIAGPPGGAGEERSLLASTPSLWPTRGWLTSGFGVRLDPASAESSMHRGLDIAAPYGAPVVAPADGTVLFAGVDDAYGKVLVIDHGFGVVTRYGHLQEIFVAPGARVKRGERIAAVGNTGRSTGPHLHYEVRVGAIPENPRWFLPE